MCIRDSIFSISTPYFWCRIFMSRIFMPGSMVPHFHVSYFHGTHCGAAFSCLVFSRLAFLMVPKIHFSHFQSPRCDVLKPRSDGIDYTVVYRFVLYRSFVLDFWLLSAELTSDCNLVIEFSIPESGIEKFVISGSRFESKLTEWSLFWHP